MTRPWGLGQLAFEDDPDTDWGMGDDDPDEGWDDEDDDVEWPDDVTDTRIADSRFADLGGQGLTLIQLYTMTDIPLTGGYL